MDEKIHLVLHKTLLLSVEDHVKFWKDLDEVDGENVSTFSKDLFKLQRCAPGRSKEMLEPLLGARLKRLSKKLFAEGVLGRLHVRCDTSLCCTPHCAWIWKDSN